MFATDLGLQGPGAATEASLLHTLLTACESADRGGAIFAWATAAGVKLLLDDRRFAQFTRKGSFDLVVGVDSITDDAALDALAAHAEQLEGLNVSVMLHEYGSLFHPKLSWFACDDELILVIGSGNLTVGGLKANWEATAAVRMGGSEAERLENQLTGWLDGSDCELLPLDDHRVRARSKHNGGREIDLKRPAQRGRPAEPEPGEGPTFVGADNVLVAEIGKGERWRQANFPRALYEGFFGAAVGHKRTIVLQHVAADGVLGSPESRESIEVGSQNYRFELGAATGPYPADNTRPIAAFVRESLGIFRYRLAMPDDPHYATLSSFLEAFDGPRRELRRVRTTVAQLQVAWPDSPLWTARPPSEPMP